MQGQLLLRRVPVFSGTSRAKTGRLVQLKERDVCLGRTGADGVRHIKVSQLNMGETGETG